MASDIEDLTGVTLTATVAFRHPTIEALATVIVLAIMRWRGIALPTDAANWRRFLFQACLNSVIPWTMVAWGTRALDAGVATILNSTAPIFTTPLRPIPAASKRPDTTPTAAPITNRIRSP